MTAAPVRRAGPADASAVADVLIRSRRAAGEAIPASVHSDDETRWWVSAVVIPKREVWLAEDGSGKPAAVLVVETTDGSDNEEKAPACRYAWSPAAIAACGR